MVQFVQFSHRIARIIRSAMGAISAADEAISLDVKEPDGDLSPVQGRYNPAAPSGDKCARIL
jgi:hypothetical protein